MYIYYKINTKYSNGNIAETVKEGQHNRKIAVSNSYIYKKNEHILTLSKKHCTSYANSPQNTIVQLHTHINFCIISITMRVRIHSHKLPSLSWSHIKYPSAIFT